MNGTMGFPSGMDVAFALIVAAILAAKFLRDRVPGKMALTLIVGGWGASVVGKFLGFLIGLGSLKGALIIMALFDVVAGAALVAGLFMELLGGLPGGVKLPLGEGKAAPRPVKTPTPQPQPAAQAQPVAQAQPAYPQQAYPQQAAQPQQAYPQQAYQQPAQAAYPQQAYPQQAYPQQAYPQQPQQAQPAQQPAAQPIYPQQGGYYPQQPGQPQPGYPQQPGQPQQRR